jgi:hypothetical protein
MRKIYLLIVTAFATACSELDLVTENKDDRVLDINQKVNVDYAKKYLSALGNSILILQNDTEFRSNLYSSIEVAFDGEKNVLFRSFISTGSDKRILSKFSQALSQVVGEASIPEVINAFNNIEGRTLYPQIFIPFYDDLKVIGKIGTVSPTLVIYTVDSPNSEYTGFKLGSDGKLKELDYKINESFAKQNETWVISINERVDNTGTVTKDLDNASGRIQGVSYPNARFNKIKITSHKEEWVAGASEVHIKRYMSFYRFDQYSSNPVAGNYSSEDAVDDGDGWRIKKVDRSDVGDWLTVNWVYVSNWPNKYYNFDNGSSFHTDYLYYVVFEYDAWPTGLRNAYIPDAGGSTYTVYTCYRSADSYYKMSNIPEYQADGLSSSSGFHFTSQY